MTVKELYESLNEIIPSSLSCEWDNDGLMVCPDENKEVTRVLFALDATEDVISEAKDGGFDVIVTHHPLIFNKLPSVTDPLIIDLIKNDIAVFSFHTRLDALDGGVNTVLANKIGIKIISNGFTEGLGVIGETNIETTEELALLVRDTLSSPSVFMINGNKPCRKVAILGGACGKENLEDALKCGCDTFITGNVGYNSMLDYSAKGLNIVMAGHFYTEFPVLDMLKKTVSKISPDVSCRIYDATPIICL